MEEQRNGDLGQVIDLIHGAYLGAIGRMQKWDKCAKRDGLDAAIETAAEAYQKLLPNLKDQFLIQAVRELVEVFESGRIPNEFNRELKYPFKRLVVAVNNHPDIAKYKNSPEAKGKHFNLSFLQNLEIAVSSL